MSQAGSGSSGSDIPVKSLTDLANSKGWTLALKTEEPEEREHRLQQEAEANRHTRKLEAENGKHSRRNEFIIYVLAGLVFLVILVASAIVIFDDSIAQNAESKKWAYSALTSLATGLMGFITGKNSD